MEKCTEDRRLALMMEENNDTLYNSTLGGNLNTLMYIPGRTGNNENALESFPAGIVLFAPEPIM